MAVPVSVYSQNLRAVYDKNGKKMVSDEGGVNVEDAAGFFANVFGGERFMDYVRAPPIPIARILSESESNRRFSPSPLLQIGEITLMKEITTATTAAFSEERADLEAAGVNPVSPSADALHPNGGPAYPAGRPSTATASSASSAATPGHPSAAIMHHSTSSEDAAAAPLATPSPQTPTSVAQSPSPPPSTTSPPPHSKKRSKMTPEQRAKLEEQSRERKRALEARIRTLTEKLTERLRPFVEAKEPGTPGDPETAAWEARMRREADDLKLESFGVELLHAIGTVYVTKASAFLKSKKFLGM